MCWFVCLLFFFFKQKTAYEMRISDWSSDVCSSDLFSIEDLNQLHVLVVEDNDHMRQLITTILRILGVAEVKAAPNSGPALEMLRRGYQIGRASCRERVCQYV